MKRAAAKRKGLKHGSSGVQVEPKNQNTSFGLPKQRRMSESEAATWVATQPRLELLRKLRFYIKHQGFV